MSNVSESSTVPDNYIKEDIIAFYEEATYTQEQENVLKATADIADITLFEGRGVSNAGILDDGMFKKARS